VPNRTRGAAQAAAPDVVRCAGSKEGRYTDSGYVMKPVHPTTFHVTGREELMAAIKQRTAPIVIENEELGRPFERYRRTLRWWIVGPIAASRIMRSAFPEIEFKRAEWRVDHTIDYKIILVPRR
jgi:hypothetical protein